MKLRVLAMLAAGACSDAGTAMPDATLPSELPARLSQAGLYADFATRTLADGTREFTPAHPLWSDAADKTRWIQLPDGARIDTSDFDRWRFPVGTKLFKEFAKDGKRLETRLIWRVGDTGDREQDMLFGAYVWDDTESEAYFRPDGAANVRGTDHDVPDANLCWRCHIGEPGGVLGFSAVQLEEVADLPLSHPPPAGATFGAPNAALGYLHANCGNCHNEYGNAWQSTSMVLRLGAAERDAATTRIVETTVGVALQFWVNHGFTTRIVPGDPDSSAVLHRMSHRESDVQMPPIASEVVDDRGVALVRAWIDAL